MRTRLPAVAAIAFVAVVALSAQNAPREVDLIVTGGTVVTVDAGSHQPSNAIWRYYWTVRKEMERRGLDAIQRARKLAEQ